MRLALWELNGLGALHIMIYLENLQVKTKEMLLGQRAKRKQRVMRFKKKSVSIIYRREN